MADENGHSTDGAEMSTMRDADLLRRLIVSGGDWLWETDSEHVCVWFSDNVKAATGTSASDLIGGSHMNFVKELAETDAAAEQHLEDLLAYRTFANFEYDVPEAEPGFSRMSISGIPVFVDGIFKGYKGIGRNISALESLNPANPDEPDTDETIPSPKEETGEAAEAADEVDPPENVDLPENIETHADFGLADDLLVRGLLDGLEVGIKIYNPDGVLVFCNEQLRRMCPDLADVYQPGKTLREMVAANLETGQYKLTPEMQERVEEIGQEAAIEAGMAKYLNATEKLVEEHELSTGSWVRLTSHTNEDGWLTGLLVDVTERQDSTNRLGEAQELQSQILDSVPAGILVFDKDDNFVLANKVIRDSLPDMAPAMEPGKPLRYSLELAHECGYLGVSGDEEIDELYKTDRDSWIERYSQRYHSPRHVSERQNPDGSWVQAIDIRNDAGYHIGVRLDISERKQKEDEAAVANHRFQNAIDALKDGFVVWDDDDRLVVCNEAFKRQVPEQMIVKPGRTYRELLVDLASSGVVEDAKGREDEWVQGLLDTREEELGKEIVFETHDGRWIMRRDLSTGRGERVGIRADVTELKKGEFELEAARDEANRLLTDFRTLVDTMDLGIVLVSEDLTTEIVNKAFYDIWNVTPETAEEGCKFRDLMDINRSKGIYDVAEEEWESYVQSRCEEVRMGDVEPREFVRADGKTLIYSVTALSGGKRLVTYYDISDGKQRESELEKAQTKAELADRAKSEFLANMSHEIRTPMNGVLGMAELLAKSELDSKQRTFTDIIVKSGNALLTIINDILDFSKIDAGQLELDPAPFKLAEAIEDVATLVSTRAKEKDLELIVRVQPGLPENMVGDVGRLRQIITNLMGNAVKFTENGHVLVEVTGESAGNSTKLKFAVSDTGIGIPEDQLADVFEKFSQVDASSTRRHEGTGLGLTITSKLVELMGGSVGAESIFGEGSTFWFEIELLNSGTQSNKKVAPVDVTDAKVLIIDDNAVNRSILLEQTASWSFDSCAAESGEIGLMVLEAAQKQNTPVECIILDYQMPGMTGFDVAKAVREHPELYDTPIVILTSVDQALSSAEYRSLGINAHLVKPARSSQLLETLVDTIQTYRDKNSPQGAEAAAVDDTATTVEPEETVVEPVEIAQQAHEAIESKHLTDFDDDAEIESDAKEDLTQTDHQQPAELDILVAEDNEVNQIVFTQILDETGYSYEIVANGRLAVEGFETRRPRLILMDVSMPEMNGLEATEAIRKREDGGDQHIPIIGVTAHALKGDRERCLEAGMDDYLSKPISPDALHSKIEMWLLNTANEAQAG